MVRLSFSGQRLSFFEQPIWPGPFAHAFFGQCDLRVNCRPSALVGPERADCVILSIWKMPTRKSGVSILIQLQAVESENGQYDCFGRRSVACGTTRYGLIRRFFAVFSANGILRRLEVQPECRLSQRSPLRRPDMIILGYASSADNTTCSRPAPGRRTALSEQGARISRSRSQRDSVMAAQPPANYQEIRLRPDSADLSRGRPMHPQLASLVPAFFLEAPSI